MMHIQKGDQVKILTGEDRGKSGPVLRVLPKEGKVIVEGAHLVRKRMRPKRQGEKGETVQVPRPVDASNVMLLCKNCGKATRIGHRTEGNRKVRYCKKCRATI